MTLLVCIAVRRLASSNASSTLDLFPVARSLSPSILVDLDMVEDQDIKPTPDAEGSTTSSRRSSVAPTPALEQPSSTAAARKHGLDPSLILHAPRKRAKRESAEGAAPAGGPAAPAGKGKKKELQGQGAFDEPGYVLERGMRLLEAVRDATEGGSPECVYRLTLSLSPLSLGRLGAARTDCRCRSWVRASSQLDESTGTSLD